jgi:tRNA (guanine-N7-)-methyltransferase
MATSDTPRRRPIRSFVLREGRLTAGQQRAFEELWPSFGSTLPKDETFDPRALFDHPQPLYLEIGFGNGESLAAMAERHPGRNYLGIEVHRPGVGHLLIRIEELGLQNLRVLREDAVEVLHRLPAEALDGVYLFFPDPWHKKRHHKRRIVQPEFLDRLHRVLKPGGRFHAATDWQDYAEHMMKVVSADHRFRNLGGPGRFTPRPPDRPLTKFEQRGQRLGHEVWDLIVERA